MQKITRPAALVVVLTMLLSVVTAHADGRPRRGQRRRVLNTQNSFQEVHVSRAIQQRISTIRLCYERRLRMNPDLTGKVTVEFTVEQSGGVSNARAIENTTNDASVASCIIGTVSRLHFDPAPVESAVTLNYPFVFAP